MLAIIGFLIIITVVLLLLSNRISPLVAMSLTPLVGALLAGFSLNEINHFFSAGLIKVTPTAIMFIFAIIYFGIMQNAGLFDPFINKIIRLTQGGVVSIAVGTVLVASIAHLDGAGATTFLITIPALLPIYKRLNMSPYLLVLLVGVSGSVMNMLPWGGPLGRAATVINSDPSVLWQPLIPLQIVALIMLLIMAIFLGVRENKRVTSLHSNSVESKYSAVESKKNNKGLFLFNVILTIGLIAVLMSGIIKTPLAFMIALCIALPVNFPNLHDQMNQIKKHAPNALIMASIIFSAGIFLGILKESTMLHSVANGVVTFIPEVIIPYLHIFIGFLGAPFELILNTDAYYFALLPVVKQIVSQYGVMPESIVYAMTIGNIIGTFVSPFSPALWLALGLADINMGRYIRYAFVWIWGFSIILMGVAKWMELY